MKVHKIDAKGKKLGRVASEAAIVLRGKDTPEFVRNKVPEVSVHIINAASLDIDDRKRESKEYIHYTGYPGGLRTKTMDQVISKKGYEEILKKAVYGMLPGNKLRPIMMKRLIIIE